MLAEVIADNVSDVLYKHGIKAAQLVDAANKSGIDLNRTFMSRLSSREHDFLLSKVDSLVTVLKQLEPSLEPHELFIPKFFRRSEAKPGLTTEQLNEVCKTMVVDLTDIGWIEIKKDVPINVVSDFMTSAVKKNITIVFEDDKKEKAAV